MIGRVVAALALVLSLAGAPNPVETPVAADGRARPVAGAPVVAHVGTAAKRPRAALTASGRTLDSGKVLVSVRSNARKVKLTYRSASNRARTATIRLRAGSGVRRLAAGSTRIRARARATTRLRASLAVRVVPTPAPTQPQPSAPPTQAQPSAPPAEPQPSAPSGPSAAEAQVVVLVNQARATARTCGTTAHPPAPALAVHDLLVGVARAHSLDMAVHGYFSHTGLDGSEPWDRMSAAGYDWMAAGENIAAGQPTPESVVSAWLASPGHCQNIMNDRFTEIGVGYAHVAASTYGHYWTQNFGRR